MKLWLRRLLTILLVLSVLAGVPLGIIAYESHRRGMTWTQFIRSMSVRAAGSNTDGSNGEGGSASLPKGEKIDFLVPQPIGEPFREPPRISNVQSVDLDQDGLLDVVVCDCQAHCVSWIRQHPEGVFNESVCAADLIAPAHVQAIDFDGDGDLDLIVAVLGMLFPNNDQIGSVVILENDGQTQFVKHVVVERVARVSDVRAGDLDGDGDMDLAVAQFGYDDGQTRWIENLGEWNFKSHILQGRSGPIHAPIADMDGDGDLDIVVLVSQEWEEIYLFEGDGRGGFKTRRIFGSDNHDFGSSGMWLADLDQDGDLDILFTNGDAFDYLPPHPWPWHGVQWLENQGSLNFVYHRIVDFGGVVGVKPADVDHDGDLDLFAVSAFNAWEKPQSQSVIWLENDGNMQFRRRDIANAPTHLQALDIGDFNGDGEIDLVTGGMHIYEPYDRVDRIVLWTNKWPGVDRPRAAPKPSATKPATSQVGPIEELKTEATEVAARLARAYPDSPEAIEVMAMVHLRFGDTASAVEWLEQCLKLDPNYADAYHGMGSVALRKGDYQKAEPLLRKAVEINPALFGAAEKLADALTGLNKFEEAIAVLENDVNASAKTSGVFLRLGAAYHQLKDYEKAKENYLAAMELDRGFADAHYGLSKACARLGQKDESKTHLERYKELKDGDAKTRIDASRESGDLVLVRERVADIYTAAGHVYCKHENAQTAETHWLKAAELAPIDTVCRKELASLYQKTNSTTEALRVFEQLGEIEPANVMYQLNIGALNTQLNRFEPAERAFKKMVDLAPDRPEGHLALVRLYLQSNRNLAETVPLARAAVRSVPSPANYALLSVTCIRNDDRDGAISAMEQAIELDPGNEEYKRIRESLRERE